jgi:CRP-like cAMP-binding protein
MACKASDLAHVKLLSCLSDKEREAVADTCFDTVFRGGQQVIGHLDRSRDVYLILSGRVLVTVYSHQGRQIAFRELRAGYQFGELAALDDGPRSASVLAIVESRLARIPGQHFRDLLQRFPCVKDALLQQLVALVRQLTERVYEFSSVPVRYRIRAELLRLALASGVDANRAVIEAPPTHEQFAAHIATHREAVSRELSRLRGRCLLERSGQAWVIPDVNALAQDVQAALGLPAPEVTRN